MASTSSIYPSSSSTATATATATPGTAASTPATKYRYAVICASNQNRSMEAHHQLEAHGFQQVCSYGTGSLVRMPGPSIDRPNIYKFGTKYDDMYRDLARKDPQLYTANGLLSMLDRNRRIKPAPQRFQEERSQVFDVIITCEERVYDSVLDDLLTRGGKRAHAVVVINVEIRDNHEDAAVGGQHILELARTIEATPDIHDRFEGVVERFVEETGCNILYSLSYY